MILRILVNYKQREKRFAVVNGSKLDRLVIKQSSSESIVGNIYFGIVTKVMPGINAAFVNIGTDKNGFLHFDDLPIAQSSENKQPPQPIHQGKKILVQVQKDATDLKGPKLTGIIELSGNAIIYMPEGRYIGISKKIQSSDVQKKWRILGDKWKEPQEGIIFRTSCLQKRETEILEEIRALRNQFEIIKQLLFTQKAPVLINEKDSFIEDLFNEIHANSTGEMVVDDHDLFIKLKNINLNGWDVSYYQGKQNIFSFYQLDLDVEKALRKIIWLDLGDYLIFEQSEAMTTIDVNTGKNIGKHGREETVFRTNERAAKEIARQIRLRNIAGMILIDFIDMKIKENRDRIIKIMELELGKDVVRTRIIGFTELGILQLTRKKTSVSLQELLQEPCHVCNGKGVIDSAETIAFRLEREIWELDHSEFNGVNIQATQGVIDAFCGDRGVHKERIQSILKIKIKFNVMEDVQNFYRIQSFF